LKEIRGQDDRQADPRPVPSMMKLLAGRMSGRHGGLWVWPALGNSLGRCRHQWTNAVVGCTRSGKLWEIEARSGFGGESHASHVQKCHDDICMYVDDHVCMNLSIERLALIRIEWLTHLGARCVNAACNAPAFEQGLHL